MSDATMTIGSDTSEATEVATVRVLRLPLVDRPSSALNIQKKLLLTWRANSAPEAMASPTTTGATLREPRIGARMPAAVMAATDTDPIARCSTAAMNHASRMVTSTGAPTSAENRPPSTSSRFVSPITAPSEPPTPVISKISPVVWLIHGLPGALQPCRGTEDHISAQQADEQRKVGVAEEGDEGVGELEQLRERAEGDQQQRHQDR